MGSLDGRKVKTLRQVDGSNGPVPIGAIGVVISGPAVLSEIESWMAVGDTARADAANARAHNPTFRGHPSRVVTVATESGWATFDLADLEPLPEEGAAAASETPGVPFDA